MIPGAIQARVAFAAIQAYAAHSYIYEKKNTSIISDHEFDALCVWILANYDWIKPHDLNDYITKGDLSAGTGCVVAGKVRGQTKDYAEDLLKAHQKKEAELLASILS